MAWSSSRLGEYSVLTMGVDAAHVGHGAGGTGAGGTGVSVTALTADPSAPADVRVELVARSGPIQLPGGQTVDGYTINGTSPGPSIRARQGDLVEVTLVNESVAGGTTLHWHGMDVPNAADGVAGVTQDAVPVGGRYVYRFRAEDAGTYWYHAHQLSHEQVERGLLGAMVIEPAASPTPMATTAPTVKDVVALLHIYEGQHTLNGRVEEEHVMADPGERVRVRVINTDQGTAAVWASQSYQVVAVDGREVNEPTDVGGRRVLVPAGGRVDIEIVAPDAGGGAARVHVGGARSVVVGPAGAEAPTVRQPQQNLDLLTYGLPLPLGFDPERPDRTYDYVIGRRPGLIDGRPGIFWTINGRMFPDVPMFHVAKDDVVRMRIANESDEVHPMHLHGHHIVVLSRDGIAAQGNPWWVDSLDVHPGERYEVAFVADNPGIWTDHCHTLPHAVEGLVAHVMYDGVTTPFTINGTTGNQPE
ncbi:MAG TPA: multicopper oxidase family protein [Intrasporangium sp.]|nr:multicopper oxidase family protein [Intrasporangium sp.]